MEQNKIKTFKVVWDMNYYAYVFEHAIIDGHYQTIILNENEITADNGYGFEAVALVEELKVGESADVDDMYEGACVITRLS